MADIHKSASKYCGTVSLDIKSTSIGYNHEIFYLPDSFVIADIENGKYVYMQKDGKVSTDRSQARIIGLNGTNDEQMFEKIIDFALLQEGKDKSK